MSDEKRLRDLGIELPALTPPLANYVNAVRTGNLLFLAGKGPATVEGMKPQGKHEALSDILESIEELKYYRNTVMTI